MLTNLTRFAQSSFRSTILNRCRSLINPSFNLPFFTSSATAPGKNNEEPVEPARGPPPIRVGFTEAAGRGVFATRRIGAGELIHTAKPLVSHPSLANISSVCYFCLRNLRRAKHNPQACSVAFCSEECREESFKAFYDVESKMNWSEYHNYCRSQSLKYPLLLKRLTCMIISGAAPADCLEILQPASLVSELILKMGEEYELLMNTFKAASISNEKLEFLTREWYIGVLARIRVNAFRIELIGTSFEDILSLASASVEAESAVGNAVYILPSFYNHDCDPNAHIIWIENVNAKLKALRDIEEGEELRICYIDASMSYEARKSILCKGFGFDCSCHRCQSQD